MGKDKTSAPESENNEQGAHPAAASTSQAPAAEVPRDYAKIVDNWFAEVVQQPVVTHHTPVFNHLMDAKEELKRRLQEK